MAAEQPLQQKRGPYTEYGPAQELAMKLQSRGAKGVRIFDDARGGRPEWWVYWLDVNSQAM